MIQPAPGTNTSAQACVDPDSLDVTWLADLPSRGDTCFPALVPEGDGRWTVYNYTSSLDGPDLPWFAGQLRPTSIYALDLRVSPAR